MSSSVENHDAVVVGGGVGGLAAAAYLGRAGKSVVLFEKASALGGRAAGEDGHGFIRERVGAGHGARRRLRGTWS